MTFSEAPLALQYASNAQVMAWHEASSDYVLFPRLLESDKKTAEKMAQIFSGAFFGALVVYLIMSNSTRLSYIHRASLEKRLNVISSINTIVAAISAFLNLFQITEVDNFVLPGSTDYSVDTARPIEWILTCPLMQLCLVLMAGSRVPESRLFYMPLSSFIVLSLGTSTLFIEKPYKFVVYAVGLMVHATAMFFNRQQIIERSNGAEGLFSGDSEFRKATLILMLTWLPFPGWYLCSPEGLNLVSDNLVIQLGWATLNVTSKFTLIFYLQRIKDNYCNRLKVKREMKGALAGANQEDDESDEEGFVKEKVNGELTSLVVETMNYLGMAENVERFIRLLQDARICTLDQLSQLTENDAVERQLPLDLIVAMQRRQAVWKLEMVDEAEKCLEAAELHYRPPVAIKDKRASLYKEKDGSSSPTGSHKSLPLAEKGDIFTNFNNLLPSQVGMYPQYTGAGTFAQPATMPSPYTQQYSQQGVTARPYTSYEYPQQQQQQQQQQQFSSITTLVAQQGSTDGGLPPQWAAPASGEVTQSKNTHASMNTEQMQKTLQQIQETLDIDKKFQKFEEKMMKKLDQSMQKSGNISESNILKKVDIMFERFCERVGAGFHDIRSSMEKSQAMIESKIETSTAAQSQGQHQLTHDDTCAQMEDLSIKMTKRMSETHDETIDWMEKVQKSMDSMTERLAQLEDVQRVESLKHGADNTFVEKIIQESRANAFTLQAKLGAMEELHKEKQRELEDFILAKVQHLVGESTQSITKTMTHKTQICTQEVLAQLEDSKTANISEHRKLDAHIDQKFQEMKGETVKTTENSYGAFTNSIRLQLEGLQGAIASKMEGKFEGLPARIQEQTQRSCDQMSKVLDSKIKETNDIKNMMDARLKETHNMIESRLKDSTDFKKIIEDQMKQNTKGCETMIDEKMRDQASLLSENKKDFAHMWESFSKLAKNQSEGVHDVKAYVADVAQSHHEAVMAVHARSTDCIDRIAALCDHVGMGQSRVGSSSALRRGGSSDDRR